MKRTMIWPSVKQCFPPTDMLSTRPTAIPPLCGRKSSIRVGPGRPRPDGSPEPDFEAQVRRAFANLEATLLAGGCGFDDIVDVMTFHTDPEKQLGTIMAVKAKSSKAPLPELDGAWGQLACGLRLRDQGHRRIPSRSSASVSRRNPPTMWDMASVGFSHISVAEPGRLAFLSGQIAATPGSEDVPKDLAGQAKLATASLAAALKELGASAQDIVMLRVYVVNATTEAFGQASPLYVSCSGTRCPASRRLASRHSIRRKSRSRLKWRCVSPEEGADPHPQARGQAPGALDRRVGVGLSHAPGLIGPRPPRSLRPDLLRRGGRSVSRGV